MKIILKKLIKSLENLRNYKFKTGMKFVSFPLCIIKPPEDFLECYKILIYY